MAAGGPMAVRDAPCDEDALLGGVLGAANGGGGGDGGAAGGASGGASGGVLGAASGGGGSGAAGGVLGAASGGGGGGQASGADVGGHVARRFDIISGKLRQGWQVWAHNNPLQHAEYHAEHALTQTHWHVTADALAALDSGRIGPDQVLAWGARFASGVSLSVRLLAYGNVDANGAAGLGAIVSRCLSPGGVADGDAPAPRVVRLLDTKEEGGEREGARLLAEAAARLAEVEGAGGKREGEKVAATGEEGTGKASAEGEESRGEGGGGGAKAEERSAARRADVSVEGAQQQAALRQAAAPLAHAAAVAEAEVEAGAAAAAAAALPTAAALPAAAAAAVSAAVAAASAAAPPVQRPAPGGDGEVAGGGSIGQQQAQDQQEQEQEGHGQQQTQTQQQPQQQQQQQQTQPPQQQQTQQQTQTQTWRTRGGGLNVRYLPPNPNPANSNSAAFYICQIGLGYPDDAHASAALDLLARVASKPCFHALRTVQRLGYTAACAPHGLHGVLGFAVKVQSPHARASVLRDRITAWLSDFAAELGEIPEERLADFKAALRERYDDPPKSLSDAAARAWGPIRRGTLDFGARQAKAAALQGLDRAQLLAFYNECVRPGGARAAALCCEVQGRATGGPRPRVASLEGGGGGGGGGDGGGAEGGEEEEEAGGREAVAVGGEEGEEGAAVGGGGEAAPAPPRAHVQGGDDGGREEGECGEDCGEDCTAGGGAGGRGGRGRGRRGRGVRGGGVVGARGGGKRVKLRHSAPPLAMLGGDGGDGAADGEGGAAWLGVPPVGLGVAPAASAPRGSSPRGTSLRGSSPRGSSPRGSSPRGSPFTGSSGSTVWRRVAADDVGVTTVGVGELGSLKASLQVFVPRHQVPRQAQAAP
ncbi:hypothetical protein FOA52_015572 [Chlamydomonas sp. UWO 241]|nr:hypothetical protein FOA52_015572 [Chlamydomonas sp. UWO 241]